MKNTAPLWFRLIYLNLGYFLIALGIVVMVNAKLGIAPWQVLSLGLMNYTPLTLGQLEQVVGLLVILLTWLLGSRPTLGTILNMVLIGFYVDFITGTGLIGVPSAFLGRLALLSIGTVLFGVGGGIYINADYGSGPRDGFMLALVKRLSLSVRMVRMGIELSVLVIGYLMGGPVGLGTVLNALLTGIVMQWALKTFPCPNFQPGVKTLPQKPVETKAE